MQPYFSLNQGPIPNLLPKLSRLKIDRSRGAAPHKPLLLLCLLEFAEEGALTREVMPITVELAFRFSSFWSVVAHRRPQRPDLKLPLFHMRSDGFWQPLEEQMEVLRYRDLPAFIRFAPAFLEALNDKKFRTQARSVLIRIYFEPNAQIALWALLGRTPPPSDSPEDLQPPADPEAVERGREGRFRIGVVTAYDYTCAATNATKTFKPNPLLYVVSSRRCVGKCPLLKPTSAVQPCFCFAGAWARAINQLLVELPESPWTGSSKNIVKRSSSLPHYAAPGGCVFLAPGRAERPVREFGGHHT